MRKSTTLCMILASVLMVGCADMSLPTSPSATVSASGHSVGASAHHASLNWDVTASGCAPLRPAPEFSTAPTSVRELTADELYYRPGAVLAQWMREADTVWAVFHEEPAGHALCLWDTAGI